MNRFSIIVIVLGLWLPISSGAALPSPTARHCPQPPGHERMDASSNGGARLICLHHKQETEK